MPSIVWDRDPREAYAAPYEYPAQEQFLREASRVLDCHYRILNPKPLRFARDDRTTAKAIWLLHMDALDSLRDALTCLRERRHRLAGRLFRDVIETLGIATYFNEGGDAAAEHLAKWYNGEVVPHRKYRQHLKRAEGDAAAHQSNLEYSTFSKFTHRGHDVLLDGYSLGSDNMLVHDRTAEVFGTFGGVDTLLVLPQVIASYMATLAGLIRACSNEMVLRGTGTRDEVKACWQQSLETETVPRRPGAFRTTC